MASLPGSWHSSISPGFHRTYEIVAASFYIRQLSESLTTYIKHCPKCQLDQTAGHKPFGNLQPVPYPDRLFHTITTDWIVALPLENEIN